MSQNWVRGAKCGVQLLKAEKFLGSARALPSRKKPIANRQSLFAVHYSLFAIRYSLSFWLGSSLALPFHSALVPRPTPLVPLKVGAQVLHHQLRTEVRSMVACGFANDYGLKSVLDF